MHQISLCSAEHAPKKPSAANSSEKLSNSSKVSSLNVHAVAFEPKDNSLALLTAQQSVLMQTAVITVLTEDGSAEVRALFDCGSQRSFVSKNLVQQLDVRSAEIEELSISVFSSTKQGSKKYDVVNLKLQCKDKSTEAISAVVVPCITSPLVRARLNEHDLKRLEGLFLADPPAKSPEKMEIDLLIGLDYYWKFVDGAVLKLPDGPTAVSSSFGWLISGTVNSACSGATRQCNSLLIGLLSPANDSELEKFWDLESIGILPKHDEDPEAAILQQFEETVAVENGRYQVRFPWKNDAFVSCLSSNRSLALGRLESLLKRLQGNEKLMTDYDAIIQEQLKRKFIEVVEDEDASDGVVHYIPHHAVVKEDRAPIKVRIVYDASAKSDRHCPSLNNVLHKGPDLIGDLFSMLIRFREKPIAVIADLEKAFLQVGLQKCDRDCTRFFWLKDFKQGRKSEIQVFRFSRVPFGVISSPFLLNATIQHHLNTYQNSKFVKQTKQSSLIAFYSNSKI